jgi:AmiR/NasT family two-component response regulator
MSSRPRILVACPDPTERVALTDWLSADRLEPVPVSSADAVADDVKHRSCDLVVVDATIAHGNWGQLVSSVRSRNPKTPIVVVGQPDPAREAQAAARGATYLSRPLERTWFGCTISMALMDTRPERRSIRKPVDRIDAVVEGVPSHIVDVSNEGLRLEVPRSRRFTTPPPFFNVSVPLLGVSLAVRRMWTSPVPQAEREASWYGAELSRNQPRVERAWLQLVDNVPGARTSVAVR